MYLSYISESGGYYKNVSSLDWTMLDPVSIGASQDVDKYAARKILVPTSTG